jgi:hypothetical protein
MAYTTPEQQAWLNAQKPGSAKNPVDMQAMDPGLAMQAASIAFGQQAPKVDLRGQPGSGQGTNPVAAGAGTWAASHPVGWDAPPPPSSAPSFNAAPAATSGPSGFKSFSGENAQFTPGKVQPTIGSQPQGPTPFKPQIGGGGTFAEQWDAQRYFGSPIPQIPVGQAVAQSPQGSNLPGSRSDGWLNTGPAMPTGQKPSGGFTMPSGGMPLPTTAVPGSYAPQIAVPQYTATPYGGTTSVGTQINPNDTLRTQQFLPGSTQNPYDQQAIAALNAVQGANVQNQYDQQAYQSLGGANMSTEFSPMVGESRDMIMERLRALSGPDRTQLAQEAYDIFRQQSDPAYQQDLRGVGQKAAALGRVGAGMTTNDLTGVLGQREQQQNLLKRSLINDAGQQTLADRLNTLNATLSGSGTLEGQDFNRQNTAAQLAMQRSGFLQGMGQDQFGREQSNAGLGMQKAQTLQGMGQDEFGRQQSNYNQNSQERAYQDYLARTALEDRIRQQEMQQQQAQQEWQNNYNTNNQAINIASQQNTQYPGIAQPQGNSYASGQSAGAAAPTYYPPQVSTQPSDPLGFDPLAGIDTSAWGPDTGGNQFTQPNPYEYPAPTFKQTPGARLRFGVQ